MARRALSQPGSARRTNRVWILHQDGPVEDPWEFETGHPASRPIEDATLVCNPR